MKILLDPGHGMETPGKRSPDGRFREYAYTRYITHQIHHQLNTLGLDTHIIVTEPEDIPLPERCRRANTLCHDLINHPAILLSIHVNASGTGQNWMNARGWSCYTTKGQTTADPLATCLYEAAAICLPGQRLRTDHSDGDPDLEADFYILKHTCCPAVLTENLFMDNREDLAFLESPEGSEAIVRLHIDGIIRYLTQK